MNVTATDRMQRVFTYEMSESEVSALERAIDYVLRWDHRDSHNGALYEFRDFMKYGRSLP